MAKIHGKTGETSQKRIAPKARASRSGRKISRSAVSGRIEPRSGEKRYFVRKERVEQLGKQGFSRGEIHELVAPPRTLGRRKEMLSLEESDRVQRLERVMEHATRVFGSLEKANAWLRKKNRALGGEMPIRLLVSETGAHEVKMQLHAIDYGIYA